MPEGGSSIYTDADGYQAHVGDILDLLVLRPRDFHAQLTWADLRNLQLLRAREASPRVGYLTLPADRVFVTFPAGRGSSLSYGDVTLQFGDVMFHSRGERRHQRTTAACEWASIAVAPAALLSFGRTLSGLELVAPEVGRVVRPRRSDGRRLERLHAEVCQVVERNLNSIANREVVRALEQDLILVLISCLADGKVQQNHGESAQRADVLPSLEALLAAQPYRLLKTREICSALAISEGTLRAKCSSTLGMSPFHYQRLRRLKLVRAELLQSKSSTNESIEEMVLRCGFPNLHRFVAEYWRFYREMPPLHPVSPADG
jgi:AraC-like DNA-binding protein